MPSKSRAQQRLMQAAMHGASFPKAQQIRSSMAPGTLREFAETVMPSAKPKKHNPAKNLGKYHHPPKGKR